MQLIIKNLQTPQLGPLDLTLEHGERLFISGPSGAGKSLLLRAIADLDPHQGQLTLGDSNQHDIPPCEWRRQLGYLPSESHWWEALIGDHFHNVDESSFRQLGLNPDALNWQVEHCSTGERQRLALLRLLQNQPQILLLDEPTANLDPQSRQQVELLLLDYQQQQQASLLWVSHDPEQIARLASRTLQLRHGKWVEQR